MRKKSGFTIVEQAAQLVPDFEKVAGKLDQQVTLRGQSESTLNNSIRRIALTSLKKDTTMGYDNRERSSARSSEERCP